MVISLALSFFQDFGPAHVPGEPLVDWVEGVALIVAIFIVVCSSIIPVFSHTR